MLCRGLPSAVVVAARPVIKIFYVYIIIGLDLGFDCETGRVQYNEVSKKLKVKIYRTIILLRCKYNSDKICASKCLPVDSICYLQKHLNAFVHINFVLAVIKKCAN